METDNEIISILFISTFYYHFSYLDKVRSFLGSIKNIQIIESDISSTLFNYTIFQNKCDMLTPTLHQILVLYILFIVFIRSKIFF